MNHNDTVEMRLGELLVSRPRTVSELALTVRRFVADRAVNASEMLYSGYAVSNVFSYSHRLREAFIHIAIYSKHVNLGFNQGTLLPDPAGILSGAGKLIRHVRIDSGSKLEEPEVVCMIDAAIDLGRRTAEEAEMVLPKKFLDKSD
ncbi:MAG: hypothetical protein ACE361_24965 [Aureliella sp.]